MTQLYFDGVASSSERAAATDYPTERTTYVGANDYVSPNLVYASIRSTGRAIDAITPTGTQVKKFSYLFVPLLILLMICIGVIATIGYRLEIARHARVERVEMRKRKSLWAGKRD